MFIEKNETGIHTFIFVEVPDGDEDLVVGIAMDTPEYCLANPNSVAGREVTRALALADRIEAALASTDPEIASRAALAAYYLDITIKAADDAATAVAITMAATKAPTQAAQIAITASALVAVSFDLGRVIKPLGGVIIATDDVSFSAVASAQNPYDKKLQSEARIALLADVFMSADSFPMN